MDAKRSGIGLALVLCGGCGGDAESAPAEPPIGAAHATISSTMDANVEAGPFAATKISFGPGQDCSASTMFTPRCAKVLSVRGMDGVRVIHVTTPAGIDGMSAKTAPGVDMSKSDVELQYVVDEKYRIWNWAKTGGSVRFDVADSGVVTMILQGVPMKSTKGGAKGTFALDATFTLDCTPVEPGNARCEDRTGPAHP